MTDNFVRKVAIRLLVFEDGTTHLYQFGYEEYQEKLDREAAESGMIIVKILQR